MRAQFDDEECFGRTAPDGGPAIVGGLGSSSTSPSRLLPTINEEGEAPQDEATLKDDDEERGSRDEAADGSSSGWVPSASVAQAGGGRQLHPIQEEEMVAGGERSRRHVAGDGEDSGECVAEIEDALKRLAIHDSDPVPELINKVHNVILY